ncbi:MAG: glycosyltransferase family 2 protein [Myxococcales bacterium]
MAVTIGLPFYNCERTLTRALQSVFAQTYPEWELLLVDDGSTDRSLEIAAAVRDSRVRLVADGENRGLVARLNQITALARTPYLCRMDGDDLAHPDRLARQIEHLDRHPEADGLGTAAVAIDAQDRPSRLRAGSALRLDDPRQILRRGGLIDPTLMARLAWFRRFPYDPDYLRAEDLELWVRACHSSVLEQLAQPLYFYREAGAVSLANYRRTCATSRKVFRRYGPNVVGVRETAGLIARSFLKESCYRAFDFAGSAPLLVGLRGSPLSAEQQAAARAAIATILRTPVPGLAQPRPVSDALLASW